MDPVTKKHEIDPEEKENIKALFDSKATPEGEIQTFFDQLFQRYKTQTISINKTKGGNNDNS